MAGVGAVGPPYWAVIHLCELTLAFRPYLWGRINRDGLTGIEDGDGRVAWAVIYSYLADMWTDGSFATLLPKPERPPPAEAPPWPGFDAWLARTPDEYIGIDGAAAAIDADAWGMDADDESALAAMFPGLEGTGI